MSASERKCPDCQGGLHEVKLLDKGPYGSLGAGIEYALPDAKRGFWSGRLAVAGSVQAYICENCGRILLYSRQEEV